MLSLGGLFLGTELIPLFPPLKAVMPRKKRGGGGGGTTSVEPPGQPDSGYRPGPYWVPWLRAT